MESRSRKASPEPRSADVLTPDEVGRLLRACSERASTGLRNRALIATLYRCGFRVSEAIAIHPEHVDASARTLRIAGRRRARTAGMDPGAFAVVERWLERRRERGIPDSAPLFCTLGGTAVSPSYVRALLPRLARKAGLDQRVSAETLRRTLALELALEGFPMEVIQAQLGHASPVTTSRFVARIAPDTLARALRARASWRP